MKALQTERAKFRAVTKIVRTRHVICGILPCVKTTILRQDEKFGRTCFFRHVKAEEKPSKKSKKGGAKGSVALLKESTQLGCVSEDSYPRKSIQRAEGKLGSKHAVKLSKGTWHQKKKNRERQGSIERNYSNKCEPHERSPCAPKFGEIAQEDTSHQERCARRVAWALSKNIYKLKNADKATFYFAIQAKVMPAPTSKSPEEREFARAPRASMHMMSKRDSSSDNSDTLRSSKTTTVVLTANG